MFGRRKKKMKAKTLYFLIFILMAVLVLQVIKVSIVNQNMELQAEKLDDKVISLEEQIICVDRFGRPISRKEVMLIPSKVPLQKKFLTIGIPTIQRVRKGEKISYLEKSLESHLKPLSNADKESISIVILLGDDDSEKRKAIQESISKKYADYIEKGSITLIYVPERFYKPFGNIPQTFGDSPWRVKWRSKQALDFSFLFYFCHGLGQYYLHLEDDIESEAGYFKMIKKDLNDEKIMSSSWVIRRYWYMGFIGKLIKNEYLKALADYWNIFYYEMPLDWTYINFLRTVSVGTGEASASYFPFKHLAKHSSSNNDDVLKNVFANTLN